MPTYELDRLLRNTTTIGKFAFRLREALFQRLYEKPKQKVADTVKPEKKSVELKKEVNKSIKIPKGASTSSKELPAAGAEAPTGKSPSEICQMHPKMGHQIPGNKIIIIKSKKSFDLHDLPKFYQKGVNKALSYLKRFVPVNRIPETSAIIFSNKCITIIESFKERSRSAKRIELVHKNEDVQRPEKCETGRRMTSTSVTIQKTSHSDNRSTSSNKKSQLEIISQIPKYFGFQKSSKEFSAVIYVLYIPENFNINRNNEITILSDVYESVTRPRTQLIIVTDKESWERLKILVDELDFDLFEEYTVTSFIPFKKDV